MRIRETDLCVLPHVWLWETNACGLREKCLFGKINEFVHENFNLLNEWEQFHHGSWGQLSHTSIHCGQNFSNIVTQLHTMLCKYLKIQECNQRGDWCDHNFINSWSMRSILEQEHFRLGWLGSNEKKYYFLATFKIVLLNFHGQRKRFLSNVKSALIDCFSSSDFFSLPFKY